MTSKASDVETLRRELETHERVFCPVGSESMEPLISVGSLIEVVAARPPFKRFDILVFQDRTQSRLVCHYLWHVNTATSPGERPLYVTRPLNAGARTEDLPITEDRILGKVVNFALPSSLRLKLFLRALFRGKRRR